MMISLRILATGISCVAIAAAFDAPAFAGECTPHETGAADCGVQPAARKSASRFQAAARLPSTLPDEQIPPSLLDPLLGLDMYGIDFAQRLGAASAVPSKPVSPVPHQSAAATTGFDTWSKLEKNRDREASRTHSGVGIDYKASPSARFGMAVENEQNVADASLSEQSKLAATFGFKTSPLSNFEAKASWARQSSGDLMSHGTESAQNELSARLNWDWRLGAIKVAPSVSVAQASDARAAEGKMPKGTVIVAPRISHPIALDNAQALEPFLTFKHEIDISAPALHAGEATKAETVRSAGGGVKLERRDNYSFSLSTDVENLDADRRSLRSEMRLNLPLN